jgi:hypothetical protein
MKLQTLQNTAHKMLRKQKYDEAAERYAMTILLVGAIWASHLHVLEEVEHLVLYL